MGNNTSEQQQHEPQQPFWVQRRQQGSFSPPPVRRPQRQADYPQHLQDWSLVAGTPQHESSPVREVDTQQQAAPNMPLYHSNPMGYQGQEMQDVKNDNVVGQRIQPHHVVSESQAPQGLQLYQAEPQVLQGFAAALEVFDRYKKQGNARAMQAFQIIDNCGTMDVQQFATSLYLLQEGLQCYGQVPVAQVKQSLQLIEVEKQKISQQMITLQHQRQLASSLGSQSPREQLTSSQLHLHVGLSQQSQQKRKLTVQQISAADEILRVYKNRRVCLKALLEKSQEGLVAAADPGGAAQGFNARQLLESQLGLSQGKIEEWIFQLVHNQNDASHFLNEYIRMVENDVKVNQTQARLRGETTSAMEYMAKGASGVSNQRSELNFKQSKVSERSAAHQNANNQLITIASNEPQEQLCQENMNNLSQLKEKLVENLDSLLFLLDEKKIQKHLKAMFLLQPTGSFLEYKRDFYTRLYSLSSPLSMSFNRHIAWKLSGILYKLSVQCQNQLNIGEAGEHARAANQHFLKYKELTKQLSKQPELEQINYLQHRQFLTKERFERNRHRVAQQLARVQELVDGKTRAIVTAHYHQAEELGAEPHQLVSLNNEGEIGTLSRGGSKEHLQTNPILSPDKEARKLLTEVHEQYPHDGEEAQEARLVSHAKKPSFNASRLQQQRSCFPRNRSKQNFHSQTAIGPFGQKATYDLRELALSRDKQVKKPVKPTNLQQKNYVKMNQQPQKRQQQQELKAQQESIQKIVKRNANAFSSTLSPRSETKTPEDLQKHGWDDRRALSPENVKFMSDQQTKVDDSPKRRQNSHSSGTPRGSAYNILKPFQQQQQALPFYAPSSEDLASASQFWYRDPNQKEKRKISLSPREQRGHQESQSTDQTPPAALNMDINNLQKPSSILQMSAWNAVGPLSVISEEKPHLLGTTAGGHSVSGGPPAFNGDHSPEPKVDPSYQDHTVVKGFKLPTTNPSVDSPEKSASRSPMSQLKPLDTGDLNKLQRLYGKDQRLKVTQVIRNRQASKEKDIKRKKDHRRRPTADLQENRVQDLDKEWAPGKSRSATKIKDEPSNESLTPRMKSNQLKKDVGKQKLAKTEAVSQIPSASKDHQEDDLQEDLEKVFRSDEGDNAKLDEVRETREEESTINQTSGFIKELKPVMEETSKSSKRDTGSAAKDKTTKESASKSKKAQELRAGAGQKDSTSSTQQAPSSIYKYLIDKDRKSPTFSPSAAAQHFRSTDPLPKNQTSGSGVSDSSQIQIKVGQKPIRNINQRQFIPKSKIQKPTTQPPFPNKTASLVSTQHDKSRDTTNQTNGSGSKARLDLMDQSKHQMVNETLQRPKEERLQPSEPKKSEGGNHHEGERPATPKAFEIDDEDSLLTQKYLEVQKPTTDKKDQNEGCLSKYDISRKDFNILRKLGKGSFGEVYLVRFVRTGELFAMKALSKRNKEDINWMRYIITERDVLVKCQSPFIARLNYAFQTNTNMFLVLEFCTGYDLDKVLTFEKYLSEERAKLYTAELILAIAELHQHDIIYRDLKPDNVVLDELGHIKLIDFGMSKEGISLSDQGARTFCGSVKYLAPEMLSKKGHGKSLDWYLIGVLFYEMLVGISPYYTSKKEDLFDNILYGKLKLPRSISNDARDLIMKLLNRSSKKRLGSQIPAQELLIVYDDNTIAEYERKLTEQFTDLDLRKTGALQVMSHPFFRDINWYELYLRNFEALPESLKPPKSKYDLEYHQKRYKESRYDSDDVERIWEQRNNKDFEDGVTEADDLHVDKWSFIHELQIESLENLAKAEEEARLLEAAKEQEANEKELSLKQESSHQEANHQIVEPVYGHQNQILSPRIAPTIHSQISIESCSQGDFQKNPELGSHLGRHLRRHYSSETYRSVQTRKTRTRSYQSQFATKSGRRGLSSGAPAERRPKLDRFGSNAQKRSASLQSNLSGHKVSVQSCDALSINRLAKQRKRRNHSNSDKNSDRSSRQGSQLHGRNYSSGSDGSSTISQYGISKKQSKNLKNIGHNQYRTTAQNEYRGNQIIIRLQNNAVGQFDIESKGKKKVLGGVTRAQKKNTNPVTSQKRLGAPNLRTERMANEKKKVKEQQMPKPIGMPSYKARPTSNLSGPSMGSRMSRHSKSRHSRNNSRSASRGPCTINLQNKNPLTNMPKKTQAQAAVRRSLQTDKLGLGAPTSKSSSLLKTMKNPTISIKHTKATDSDSQLQPSIISNSLKTSKASAKGGLRKLPSRVMDKRGRNAKNSEQKRLGSSNLSQMKF